MNSSRFAGKFCLKPVPFIRNDKAPVAWRAFARASAVGVF
jgi:hypothetical protein